MAYTKKLNFLFNCLAGFMILAVGFPQPTMASGCNRYLVSGAGLATINGVYEADGTHQGRPVYKHINADYYISYNAYSFMAEEWNLTTAPGGGLDLYFKQANSFDVPEGYWPQGLRGSYPGATVKYFPCSEKETKELVFDIRKWKRSDSYQGTIGIFTPSGFVDGTIKISDILLDSAPHKTKLNIVGKVLKVEIRDAEGREQKTFLGLNYLYFNLNAQTAKLWEAGNLHIYKHNINGRKWFPITTYFVDAGEHGRVATITLGPGYYALGSSE